MPRDQTPLINLLGYDPTDAQRAMLEELDRPGRRRRRTPRPEEVAGETFDLLLVDDITEGTDEA